MAAFELMCVLVLLGVFLGVAMLYNTQMLKRTRTVTLQAELRNLRATIMLFETKRRRFPATLQEAQIEIQGHLHVSGGSRPRPVVHEGPAVDPFGNPYRYDSRTGVVTSNTAGFESW